MPQVRPYSVGMYQKELGSGDVTPYAAAAMIPRHRSPRLTNNTYEVKTLTPMKTYARISRIISLYKYVRCRAIRSL